MKLVALIVYFILSLGSVVHVQAQSTSVASADSVLTLSDSVSMTLDSLRGKADFDTVVFYKATDSIVLEMDLRKVTLYNTSNIEYGKIKLDAYFISLDWKKSLLNAVGYTDSTQVTKGSPIFVDNGDTYKSKEITYNFKTEKALVKGVITEQGDGIIHGERVKRTSKSDFFVKNGLYTTCEADHPHFGIRSKKIKMVAEKEIISGPFQLEISDIPTPIGFPFGFVPIPKKRSSGVVMPSYGETRERGFFLRDGGYYWAVNEYVDLVVLGEIYSRGGYGGRIASRYNLRYHFNGNFDFKYNNRPQGEKGTPERTSQQDFWVSWSHKPVPRGTGRFSASVSAGTSTYNKNNSYNVNNYLSSSFNSSVSYAKTFTGTPFNFNSSIRHTQNVQTKIVGVSPQVSFGMNRIFPLKKLVKGNKWSVLQQLGLSYNMQSKMEITNLLKKTSSSFKTNEGRLINDTIAFNVENIKKMLSEAQMGAKHAIPVSTAFSMLKYLTVSPSLNYEEVWYKERYKYSIVSNDTVNIDTLNRLSRFYSYNYGTSISTRLYSFFYFKSKRLEAIRHVVTPTIGYTKSPDFSDPSYGFYTELPVGTNGALVRSANMNGVYGAPSQGKSGTISVSLDNNLEMKIRKKIDDEKPEKVAILENFTVRGSYNMAVDSFNLSNIAISGRTKLFNKKVNVNVTSQVDPYTYVITGYNSKTGKVTQRRTKDLAWKTGNGLGNLKSVNVSLGTTLNPDTFKALKSDKGTEEEVSYINENRDQYVDFSVPWNLKVDFNMNYNKTGFDDAVVTKTMNFRGDVSLTQKWKVSFSTGYDFQSKSFSFTSIDVHRDLHCWQMSLNWIPFGPRQSYMLDLGVKASVLQDLKLSKRNNWYDRR